MADTLRTIALCNLGCGKNIVDGERMLKYLESAGYCLVDDFSKAAIIVVNTCAFIREAREEAIESILEMAACKKTGVCTTLVVAGCFSQRYATQSRAELPEVDHWISVDAWEQELARIFALAGKASFERHLSEPVATQYLKIAEGCNHHCSFCVIPEIRGNYRSRAIPEILTEAAWLYSQGARELILVSQDTSWYGKDNGSDLAILLQTLLKETDFPWIRTMYLHPAHIDDRLLELFASEKRLLSYFDIPLQHASDPILMSMKRVPLSSGLRDLVKRIRSLIPEAAIRTSFIVGFPGETEKSFRELVEFVEWARFDKVGVFPFSPEEGTPASLLKSRPRTATAVRRAELLMEAQRAVSRELLAAKVGTTVEVIIDRISEEPDYNFEARTQWDAPEVDGKVYIVEGSFDPGTIVPVRIADSSDYDLYALPVQ